MLKKSVGISAAALAFGLMGVLANGCSSTSTTVGPAADGGGDTGIKKDGGTGGETGTGTGDTACFDASTVLSFSTAPLAPAANQGKCASDALVTAFLTACITQGDAGVVDSGGVDACTAYIDANATCALCLGGFSNPEAGTPPASPWPALTEVTTAGNVVPAVAVCLAALSAGTDTCKSNFANDDLCTQTGCAACSATDYTACATAETTDPTSTCLTTNPLDATCTAALNAVSQTDADSKCGASTQIKTDTDFTNVFMLVAKTLCE